MHHEADAADEMLEIVNLKGDIVGLAHRDLCHSSPELIHQAVHVFVYDRNQRLFLQKRSRFKRIQPGKWDTSVGGHVDPGESPLKAACRESAEELGLAIAPAELIFLHRYLWRSDVETELITSYRFHSDGPFTLHPDEIDEGRFYTAIEIEDCLREGTLTPCLAHELMLLKTGAPP